MAKYATADEVKESHWRMEIAFGVALEILKDQFKMKERVACDLLFPPLGEGPMDSDVPIPVPVMAGYEHIPWKGREAKMLADQEDE